MNEREANRENIIIDRIQLRLDRFSHYKCVQCGANTPNTMHYTWCDECLPKGEVKVFLDDERETPEGWFRVYTIEEIPHLLLDANVVELSLDHDLGYEKSGYDALVQIEGMVYTIGFRKVPKLTIHSANPVGRKRMEAAIESIKKRLESL